MYLSITESPISMARSIVTSIVCFHTQVVPVILIYNVHVLYVTANSHIPYPVYNLWIY